MKIKTKNLSAVAVVMVSAFLGIQANAFEKQVTGAASMFSGADCRFLANDGWHC